MRLCVLMLIGHGREQRPDAVGEIAHFEYWNQTVITAWRRCHHFTSCTWRHEGNDKGGGEKATVFRPQDENVLTLVALHKRAQEGQRPPTESLENSTTATMGKQPKTKQESGCQLIYIILLDYIIITHDDDTL